MAKTGEKIVQLARLARFLTDLKKLFYTQKQVDESLDKAMKKTADSDLDMAGHEIKSATVSEPVEDNEIPPKSYVDKQVSGASIVADAFPADAKAGAQCYRSDRKTQYIYDGATWLPVSGSHVRWEINSKDGGLDAIVEEE